MHDGSYEAHTLSESGELTYDPTKDKRFSYYFENREKHKDSQGQFIPAKSDKEYNIQRNTYNLVMGQMNEERIRMGYEEYTENDFIEHAYSEKERQSYKSFTDTVYGAYDKDAQAEWHHT